MSEKISPIRPISRIDLKNNNQFQHERKEEREEKQRQSFADRLKKESKKLEKE